MKNMKITNTRLNKFLEDLCVNLNNCTDCYDDEMKQCKCCPLMTLNLCKIDDKHIYLDPYSADINEKLKRIAISYGYCADLVRLKETEFLRFTIK